MIRTRQVPPRPALVGVGGDGGSIGEHAMYSLYGYVTPQLWLHPAVIIGGASFTTATAYCSAGSFTANLYGEDKTTLLGTVDSSSAEPTAIAHTVDAPVGLIWARITAVSGDGMAAAIFLS